MNHPTNAAAAGTLAAGKRVLHPAAPTGDEAILWEGRPGSGMSRLFGFASFAMLLALLTWLAFLLILPHLGGSRFAGHPTPSALPLILVMMIGMLVIMAFPVWLRMSAKGRASYMLTTRRALIWLGRSIVGEAALFGAEMEISGRTLIFDANSVYLDWRMQNEGPDRIIFEQIADPEHVAQLAEKHGAHWRPAVPDEA